MARARSCIVVIRRFVVAKDLVQAVVLGGSRHIKDGQSTYCIADAMAPGFIYLLREREFIRSAVNVYKFGRAVDFEQRFQAYPRDSEIIVFARVLDAKAAEDDLIRACRDDPDVVSMPNTREYFEADVEKMQDIFYQVVVNHKYKISAQASISKAEPKADYDIIVIQYMRARETYSETVVPLDQVFVDFREWTRANNYEFNCSLQTLSARLKAMFGARMGPMMTIEGMKPCLTFPRLVPLPSAEDPVMHRLGAFVDEHMMFDVSPRDMLHGKHPFVKRTEIMQEVRNQCPGRMFSQMLSKDFKDKMDKIMSARGAAFHLQKKMTINNVCRAFKDGYASVAWKYDVVTNAED